MNPQHVDDHLPGSCVALAAIAQTPVRGQLVRFLHSTLLAVPEGCRLWEQEREITTTTSGSSKKPAASFTTVFSECLDLYTSAAALILTIPEDGNSNCKAHLDIPAMLKMQMDELAEDQLEKQIMNAGD